MSDKDFKLTPVHLPCETKACYDGFRYYCEKCDKEFKEDEVGFSFEDVKKMKELIDSGVIEIPPEERVLPN